VINLIGDSDLEVSEQAMVEQQGMRYVNIPMSTRTAPTAKQIETFLALVNDAASQPVYVHCVGGRHRTGVMTAVYRMTNDGLTGDQAFTEMKKFKYGPDFLHPEFKQFVRNYEVKKATAAAANAGSQQQ
jgi:protein tyrosine/serine phosphatase